MNNPIIELAEITLAKGITESDLINASEKFQGDFLAEQPGFISRHLSRTGNGKYTDVVFWKNRASADAIMEKAQTSEACGAYFSIMEANQDDPTAGVVHYEVLHSFSSTT